MKKLIPALLSLLLLSGCRALREPTDMFVIAGAALDWDGTRYRLANEMGDTGSTKDDLPRSRVFTGTGQTVSACLFDMASRAEREIYFGKTEVLMLQETMPADKRCQALELFLDHRSDHQVLLCALRADSPEAALSFGEQAQLRTGVVMGLLKDGARRVYCRTVQAEDVPDRGAYMLPEITVDDRGIGGIHSRDRSNVRLGNDQKMGRRLRINIVKRKSLVVLIHLIGRDIPLYDLTKQTVGHDLTSSYRPRA